MAVKVIRKDGKKTVIRTSSSSTKKKKSTTKKLVRSDTQAVIVKESGEIELKDSSDRFDPDILAKEKEVEEKKQVSKAIEEQKEKLGTDTLSPTEIEAIEARVAIGTEGAKQVFLTPDEQKSLESLSPSEAEAFVASKEREEKISEQVFVSPSEKEAVDDFIKRGGEGGAEQIVLSEVASDVERKELSRERFEKENPFQIREPTQEELFRSIPVIKEAGEFKSGLQSFFNEPGFAGRLKDDPTLTPSERIGGVVGLGLSAAGLGGALPVSISIPAEPFLKVGKSIALPTVTGLTAQKATTAIAESLLPEEFEELKNDKRLERFIEEARKEVVRKEAGKGGLGFGKAIALETIPTLTSALEKKDFEKELRLILAGEGVFGSELERQVNFGKASLAIKEGGQLAALLAAGASTERIGAAELRKITPSLKPSAFLKSDIKLAETKARESLTLISKGKGDDILKEISKAAAGGVGKIKPSIRKGKLGLEIFKTIAPLGAAEGITESIAEDISRGLDIDLGKAALSGAVAAPLAGGIGTSIALSKGARRKAISGLANILDVTEKPGDIIADVSGNIKKVFDSDLIIRLPSIPTPFAGKKASFSVGITSPSIGIPSISIGTQTDDGDFKAKEFDIPKFKPRGIKTRVKTPSIGIPGSKGKSLLDSKLNIGLEDKVKIDNNVNIDTGLPVKTDTSVPVDVGTGVPVDTSVNVDTNIPIGTSIPVSTSVPVSTTVAVPVNIPVIPSLSLGLSKSKPKKKRSKGYDVFVKEKGKFKRINKVPRTRSSALDFANFLVENSNARSFKIKDTKLKGSPKAIKHIGSYNKKRYKVKKDGTNIEKSKFAINTEGEFLGITAKGLARIRSAKKLKQLTKRKKGLSL